MQKRLFGTLSDGTEIEEYTLKSAHLETSIITLGGAMRTLLVRGRDIIGGYDTLGEYVTDNDPYQGAVIGRVGGRIENGRFTLNGKEYQLSQNQNGHHLHGGFAGFNRRVWTVEEASDDTLVLSRLSPDGEEGYPGNLFVEVTYTVKDDCLMIEYRAKSDADTPVNLTNHAFYNLGGIASGDILDHTVMIRADRYTEIDERLIPTGNRPSVAGTPFDFRTPKAIRRDLNDALPSYDHNFIFEADLPCETVCGVRLPHVASISAHGITMDIYTTSPGAQLYTGAFLDGPLCFKGGVPKEKHHAFCFETQLEPDGIHHGTPPLRAGELFTATTVYRFR